CSATSRPRGPNELWLADLSYLRCWKGLVFFAFAALGRRGPRRLLHARRGDQPGRARSRAPSSRPPVRASSLLLAGCFELGPSRAVASSIRKPSGSINLSKQST